MDAKNVYQSIDVNVWPEREILSFVEAEFESLRQQIIANIQGSGKTASGDTERSLRIEKEGDKNISLIGREHFEELETGTPPRAQPANFNQIILKWAEAKPIPIRSQIGLEAFAEYLASKIERFGTEQYVFNERVNIYSDEVLQTWDKIDDFIDQKIKYFLDTITL